MGHESVPSEPIGRIQEVGFAADSHRRYSGVCAMSSTLHFNVVNDVQA